MFRVYIRGFAKKAAKSLPPVVAPFEKILIANRGEIAIRVMKTAKKMGIKTVAIYSDADRGGMHVKEADEAVYVGPSQSKLSYLNINNIVNACKTTGAQAVHPGYGFLSENALFEEELVKAGIKFIGPKSKALRSLGDKIMSKKIAQDAGVSIVPGYVGEVPTVEDGIRISREIGYPVMIKASAGGGGKGMRVAWNDEDARSGFELAKNEALSSFGDDRLLIEKFIQNPKHIEIQLMGDEHGGIAAFPERDCSVQRRNQKVFEESPCTTLPQHIREEMCREAKMLAKAVEYSSAGTVEFLLDKDDNKFYFLEMNTRLQVEHPVSELVSGEDLVEHMINSAAGKKLPERLTDPIVVPFKGHAIEARIYAEDPIRGFTPSIGLLSEHIVPEGSIAFKNIPKQAPGVRCDTGIAPGSAISIYYDPMISKLCTYSTNRTDALLLMEDALSEYAIRGVRNNLSFLTDVVRNYRFRSGDFTTKFIGQEYPKGFKGTQLTPEETEHVLSAMYVFDSLRKQRNGETSAEEKDIITLKGMDGKVITKEFFITDMKTNKDEEEEGKEEEGDEEGLDGSTTVTLSNGMKVQMALGNLFNNPVYFAAVDDTPVSIQLYGEGPKGYSVSYKGAEFDVQVRKESVHSLMKFMKEKKPVDTSKFIMSPMAGALIKMYVEPGQHVSAGQSIAIVEAMKMQNKLVAEKDGVVKSVKAVSGSNVSLNQILVEFEEPKKE